MSEKLVYSVSLFLMLGLTGQLFGDTTIPRRFYSDGTGLNGMSNPMDPNEVQPDAQPSQYPALRRRLFDIGTEAYLYEYKEPGLMKEEGVFYGVRFGYTDHTWYSPSSQLPSSTGGFMFRADGRVAFGQVDYDGGIYDYDTDTVIPYSIDNIDDWVFEGRFLLGGDWLLRSLLQTLYAGIGYRYLNDDSSFDPAGYLRESNYVYVPIGYRFDSSTKTGWSFGFGAEFDIFIFGRQKSHLSDIGPSFSDIINDQYSGLGYRASVTLQHKSRRSIFVLEPFIRYWDIDDSEIEYMNSRLWIEPANNTIEYGVSVIWMI